MMKYLLRSLLAVVAVVALAGHAAAQSASGEVLSVASNTALKALPVHSYATVTRLGFSAAGDGGAARYNFSGTACSAPDNGLQVSPNSGTGCWVAEPQQVYSVLMWGAVCSLSTDSSSAVLAAIGNLFKLSVSGGTLFFPCIVTMNSALAIPYTGTSPPVQPYLRLTAQTLQWGGTGLLNPPTPGGGGLNLLYTGGDGQHPAKIDTRGAGTLELDHLVIKDTGTDNFLMLQTTNTTVLSHSNHYSGNPACVAPACSQDIIQWGGITSAAGEGGTTSPTDGYTGYGSYSRDDKFSNCRHAMNFGGQANAIEVANPVVDFTCGSQETYGAAFTWYGAFQEISNNIRGGIIELTNYPYGFAFLDSGGAENEHNFVNGTYVGDAGPSTVGVAYFASTNDCGNWIAPAYAGMPLLNGPGAGCNTAFNASTGFEFGDAPFIVGGGDAATTAWINGSTSGTRVCGEAAGTEVPTWCIGSENLIVGGSNTKLTFYSGGGGFRFYGGLAGAGIAQFDSSGNLISGPIPTNTAVGDALAAANLILNGGGDGASVCGQSVAVDTWCVGSENAVIGSGSNTKLAFYGSGYLFAGASSGIAKFDSSGNLNGGATLIYPLAFSGGATTQAGNTTVYYGSGLYNSGGIVGSSLTLPAAGTLGNLYVTVSNAPGAGQTYTATLYNAGATVVTCTISGASAAACNDTSHTASLGAGSTPQLQVVSSSGAASVTLSWGFTITK